MAGKKKRGTKYVARVARIRIETALVEFEFDEDRETYWTPEDRALQLAEKLSEKAWRSEKSPRRDRGLLLQNIVSEDDRLRMSAEAGKLVSMKRLADDVGPLGYVLLVADRAFGEGRVVLTDWLLDESSLMVEDLCEDWVDGLSEIASALTGAYDDDDAEDTEPAPPRKPRPPRKSAKIIPFRRSASNNPRK